MQTFETVAALRAFVEAQRRAGKTIGLVPTMGALHEGHFSLVRESLARGHITLVSIFVNPTQFGPNEDFARYPRTLNEDAHALSALGAQGLFAPAPAEVYPEGFTTTVHVRGITDYLCGPFRPGHFDGVATVVAKLLNMAVPDEAFFGQKDWQQLQVITRLAHDLDLPARITGLPTVREVDGLALSSRNRYLDEAARKMAALIPATLSKLAGDLRHSPQDGERFLAAARIKLQEAGFSLDYLSWADAQSCVPVTGLARPSRVFVAARLKSGNGAVTRLIDNMEV